MILAVALLLSAGIAQSADLARQRNIPEELGGIPQAWVGGRLPGVRQDVSFLAYAYEVPEEAQAALRHLVYARMVEQHSFERRLLAIDLSQRTGAERLEWLDDYVRNNPLSPDRLEALAESLLPPRDFSTPRRVFVELRARRDQRQRAELTGDLQRQQLSVWMKRQRVARAPVTQAGHPVPMWVHALSRQELAARISREKERDAALRQSALRRASRDPGGEAVRRIQRERADKEPDQADKPLVVRVFDDTRRAWRGSLEKIVADQGLVGGRRANVEKTFSQIWKRAQAFRATQRAAYLDLETLSSRKAFAQALARLDAPLRPLFEEFKLRLDSQVRSAR